MREGVLRLPVLCINSSAARRHDMTLATVLKSASLSAIIIAVGITFTSAPAMADDCLLDTNLDGVASSGSDTDLGAGSNGDDSRVACGANALAHGTAICAGANAAHTGATAIGQTAVTSRANQVVLCTAATSITLPGLLTTSDAA
jgi:hypothetical protein